MGPFNFWKVPIEKSVIAQHALTYQLLLTYSDRIYVLS